MEHLHCVVERITYQNEENGYSVLKVAVKNYRDLVTVVGTMPETHVGSVLSLDGAWKVDAKYGRQFSVERFEETLPATIYGIEKYLGSGLVKGVGPKFELYNCSFSSKNEMSILLRELSGFRRTVRFRPAVSQSRGWRSKRRAGNLRSDKSPEGQ